eukprot:scaffold13137_cov57-Cyclotella_meneghiniana.AAC.6
MKTTTTLLLLLSLIATTNADDNTREVKRTEAQKFAEVSNPQLLTIQQFKKKQQQQTNKNNSIGGIGSGFANKLKVAMGELNNSKNAADDNADGTTGNKREHGSTNIRPRKKKNANDTAAKLTMAQQIKQEQTEGKDEALSKLSLNLGQAIKENTNGNKRGSRKDV